MAVKSIHNLLVSFWVSVHRVMEMLLLNEDYQSTKHCSAAVGTQYKRILFISLRIDKDWINHFGSSLNVPITKKLCQQVEGAHSRCMAYPQEKKKI